VDTIGFVELSSIAAGVEIADAMLKAANVDLIYAKASCPGKYNIMISGVVTAVENSVRQGLALGQNFVVDSLVLSKIHPQVIKAINMSSAPDGVKAVGVMEFFSVTASILAADTAVKASSVELIDVRLGTGIGGKSFVVLTGEPASVRSAISAASAASEGTGMMVNKVIIDKPRKELVESLF
jgi:microcompartment protein CcmL/EutN